MDGGEAGLGDARAQGKGLEPPVGKQGDHEGKEAVPGALGAHPQALQEGVDGEGHDKDKGLGLGGGRVDSVHVAAADDVVLMAGPVLGVGLQGELRVVMRVAVAVVSMMVVMLMVMSVIILVSKLLCLGHLRRVSIGAVRVRQEETIDGKENQKGDSGEERAPGKAVAVSLVMTVCVAMAMMVIMIVLVGLGGFDRFVRLLLVLVAVTVLVAVAITVVLGEGQVGEGEKTRSSRLDEGRGDGVTVAVGTIACRGSLHHLRNHVHQHSTQDNTTGKAVAVT